MLELFSDQNGQYTIQKIASDSPLPPCSSCVSLQAVEKLGSALLANVLHCERIHRGSEGICHELAILLRSSTYLLHFVRREIVVSLNLQPFDVVRVGGLCDRSHLVHAGAVIGNVEGISSLLVNYTLQTNQQALEQII